MFFTHDGQGLGLDIFLDFNQFCEKNMQVEMLDVNPITHFGLGLSSSRSSSGSDLEDELMVGFENGVAKLKQKKVYILLSLQPPKWTLFYDNYPWFFFLGFP